MPSKEKKMYKVKDRIAGSIKLIKKAPLTSGAFRPYLYDDGVKRAEL